MTHSNSSLEEQLRETLGDTRRALPGWADATERVRHGVIRRRRRRNLTVAGVALAVAVLVAVPAVLVNRHSAALPPTHPQPSTSTSTSAATPPAVVPWLNSPAVAPVPAPPSNRPTATPCLASDLAKSATYSYSSGEAGTQIDFIGLRNTGHRRCTLSGYPDVQARDVAGHLSELPSTNESAATPQTAFEPATVDPGESATFAIRSSSICNGGVPITAIRTLDLRVAGELIPINGEQVSYACSAVSVGRWYFVPPTPTTPAPGALADAGVTATLVAPASVVAGTRLDYQVVLTNPGDAAVSLVPCPVYQQNFYKAHSTYALNCAGSNTNLELPGHSTVKYAMQIDVPAYTPAGQWQLTWEVDEARGPTAAAKTPVTVTVN